MRMDGCYLVAFEHARPDLHISQFPDEDEVTIWLTDQGPFAIGYRVLLKPPILAVQQTDFTGAIRCR